MPAVGPPDGIDPMEAYICTLPEDARRCAEEELGEDPEQRTERIREVQEWLRGEAAYLNARDDDLSVLKFLRGCKFDLEVAQGKLRNFYEMRRKIPEWYSDRDPALPEIQEMLKLGAFLPLLGKTESGQQVALVRAAVHEPRKHKQNDLFKTSNMIVDLILHEDELISVYGIIAVVDLKGVTLGHALQMTPSVIWKAVHAWQDCYPVRIKSINFINAPSYVDVVLNIFRRFMNKKMAQRVFVHGHNIKSFHEIVPPEILPKEYGGSNGKLEDLVAHWKKTATEKRDWFIADEKYKAEL
ncbi:retinol-binding protein pinta-like [Hetaerina americana]|uniref:retinol-binding protein pinta-like n=1 Tax=Hetaerina americana TaxID=62018 RepID=UPI003A7F58BB